MQAERASQEDEEQTRREVEEIDADALTALVLDVLGPALAWWRVEAARRLGLDATSFSCLELLRRRGRVQAALVGERTGLTRSSVSKLLRRLEQAGHVELLGGAERGQVVEARLRPHTERDAELARIRHEVRFRLRYVAMHSVDEPGRAAAVGLLRHAADALHGTARQSSDEAAEARRAVARETETRRRIRQAEAGEW